MKLRILATATALTFAAGCVSVLPKPATASGLFRLGEIAPSASLKHTLIVREPEGTRVFSGRALAAEGDDGALRLIRGVEWAQAAARMLQTGLLDTFNAEGGGVALAKGVGAPGDLELAWRMSDFTVSGRSARCELELTLLNARTRKPILQQRVKTYADAVSDKAPDRAQALAEAARACVTETAEIISAVDAGLDLSAN